MWHPCNFIIGWCSQLLLRSRINCPCHLHNIKTISNKQSNHKFSLIVQGLNWIKKKKIVIIIIGKCREITWLEIGFTLAWKLHGNAAVHTSYLGAFDDFTEARLAQILHHVTAGFARRHWAERSHCRHARIQLHQRWEKWAWTWTLSRHRPGEQAWSDSPGYQH